MWLPIVDAFRTLVFAPPAQMRWLIEMIGEFWGGRRLVSMSKQLHELVDRQVRIPNDGA